MCEIFHQGISSSVALNFSRKYGAMDTSSPYQLVAEKSWGVGASGMLGQSKGDMVLTKGNETSTWYEKNPLAVWKHVEGKQQDTRAFGNSLLILPALASWLCRFWILAPSSLPFFVLPPSECYVGLTLAVGTERGEEGSLSCSLKPDIHLSPVVQGNPQSNALQQT